jgi:hypothetical protein
MTARAAGVTAPSGIGGGPCHRDDHRPAPAPSSRRWNSCASTRSAIRCPSSTDVNILHQRIIEEENSVDGLLQPGGLRSDLVHPSLM